MHPDDAALTVFLSYAGTERAQALQVRAALERRGISVFMDVDFEPGESPLISMGRGINSGVFLPLISTAYLDHRFTQLEVSAAVMTGPDGLFLPILIENPPAPATENGRNLWTILRGKTYRLADMTEVLFDELALEVRRKARRWHHEVVPPDPVDTSGLSVALLYDWEDGHLTDGIVSQCADAGLTVVGMVAAGVPDAVRQVPAEAHIAVPWTTAAQGSHEVTDAVVSALAAGREVLYLVLPGSPPSPDGAVFIRLESPGNTNGRPERPASLWARDRTVLRARLSDALRLNDGVPFHLLGDKFCASRDAAGAVTAAYQLAVSQFPMFDEARMEAVLAYAAVCRFNGEWRRAAELLAAERVPDHVPGAPYPPAALAIAAERLSLDFELGRITDIESRAKDILRQALAAGDWPLIIAIHRQLGMLAEERGEYRLARDHLDRACHYAEDLLETPSLVDRIPSYPARVALRADCLRELAAAEWRAGDSPLATEHLAQASHELTLITDKPVADYLLRVIDYQAARIAYSTDHDYEAALGTLRASYRSLQKFDNPIRLATVLESLVQLDMDFLRGGDDSAPDLRATLEKIRRVRRLRGHDYMIARTTKSLGDLEFALGDFPAALEQYEEASAEFNRLGKYPELAETKRSMAQCDARLGHQARAIDMLEDFRQQLSDLDLHTLRGEIRAEIARLRTRRVAQDEIVTDTEMIDVGEYSVHEWITSGLVRVPGIRGDGVILGAGDDGAVLRLGSGEDLIVSTDSVPPGLMAADSERSARYAARFAVVSALSDIIAMGGEPMAILVNLHLQRTTTAPWARSFLRNVASEAARYGAAIVGGDLRERSQKALTVTAIGRVRRDRALTRGGARPGDMVVLTLSSGPGQEFAGLGTRWAQALAPSLSQREAGLIAGLVDRDATFADLGLPQEIMRAVAAEGLANSAIDTSDGVLACAQFISEAAGVGIELFPEKMKEFVNPDVIRLAESLGIEPFLFALNAGYDWEVICTVPKTQQNALNTLCKASRSGYPRAAVIGEVTRRRRGPDEGVILRTPSGSSVRLPYFTGEKFRPRTYGSHAREWLNFATQSTRLLQNLSTRTDASE
jgi:thiamine-monophosphate kinase